jgi:hypothetical protein
MKAITAALGIFLPTTSEISEGMIRELLTERIEALFGLVGRVPHRMEWLSDNVSAYTAH